MEVVKRTSGIPRSFIERDKDPENNPIIQLPAAVPEEKQVIPEDLICAICKDLFTDAVMIPCCGSSFCDECVRTALLESEDNECPDCKEKGSSPGSLIPNRFLRNSVNAFRNETGYTKAPQKANNKQTKPVEEPVATEQTAVSSSTNVAEASIEGADGEEKKEHSVEEGQQESTDHCDLHESYEEVSQHGDIGSPNGDDKAFDNDSDYEDGITVTVPPAHVQSRGASRLHYNGRSSHYPRHETPPTGGGYEYPREPYNSGTSSSGGSRSERPEVSHEEGRGAGEESRAPKREEDKDGSYNNAPAGAPKHEYGSRSPDYHQPSRGLIPLPTRGHLPQHPSMGGHPPHSGYMGAPHQGPPGPGYPGAPHPAAPHPYPGAYGMQPGYPPQRPYDHPGGMYHGERPPRMIVIDDPLEAFNRIMREKERRKEQEAAKQASRHRSSPHADRSRRSRSFENSGSGNRSSRRSAERDRRRSPRARSPDRRRSPEEKHGGGERSERERGGGEGGRGGGGGGGRRRNRSSSYSSGSRSYSRSPAKRGKSPKRRSSRSPQYRERRSRSRSKSFDERRHSKHSKDRSRDERRDDHRGEYRDNRERSPGYGSHYSGYRGGRGSGGYRGGMRGRGGSRDGGYYPRSGYGGERGHMPQQGPDQYGHPGMVDYHHHDPSVVGIPPHHHGVAPMGAGPAGGGHYAVPVQQQQQQQVMAAGGGGPAPSRFPPRDVGRDPYMGGHPAVKSDSMGGYYDDPAARQVPIPQQQQPQQQAPTPSVEPPPPGFEEQDTWSGKQESDYRAPANVTAIKTVSAEEAAYGDYHNTPKSRDRDEQRGHTPVMRDGDRHHHDQDKEGGSSSSKKKSRDDGGDRSREERRVRSKTPDRHDKDKSKRGDREDRGGDKDKKRPRDVSKDKRGAEKERHREAEKSRERETKRKQRDSSEEEKRDKKKDKEKKKRKKEKEAEKKKHKKERKEKDKDKRSKEGKKERKTVEKEEADSSLQPATPKHAPRREEGEKEQPQVDTTQEYMAHELDDTLVIPERCHDLSKTASEGEDNSYREEPSSSHDQQEEPHQHLEEQVDHSDLYSDIPDKYEGDQLEKSVLEGHLGDEEDADLVNSSGVAAEDQDDIKRSDSILDLHANLDFEGELEEGEHQSPPKFIGIPELSKWELDEDTPLISSTERKVMLDEGGVNVAKHDDSSTKVTNEVLKRAENAIFTRAINAIRPIEIKKISVDRQKLYANEGEHEHDVVEIKNDKQQDELKRFQVTVPTNDDHAERSVEIKDGKLDGRGSPVRASIKERLGSKITDVIRGSSTSTFSRSRTPPQSLTSSGGLRKVKSSTVGSSSKLVVDSTSSSAAVAASSSSRKRTRSKSADRDRGRRDDRGGGRRGEEIKISSSSSGGSRRVDIARRLVVSVREVTPEKRADVGGRSKDRRSRERVAKEPPSSGGDRSRDRVVRRSRERSREKRMEREREREKERKRGGEKDSSRRKSPEKRGDDKKVAPERRRAEGDSERRRRERSASPSRRIKDEDPGKRFVEALGRVVQEEVVPAKKSKADKSLTSKPAKPASSSDSSSSDSESSSSDSSSDSDDEAAVRKRKKRKHKKERKRAKRSASTDSDDSGGKKKKKSKKSKSGKKKKKEKKHRK
ncbi:hypothetical protein pipiens_020302, partial [Culex pipiens pipiens]